jgi:hypothetical protein
MYHSSFSICTHLLELFVKCFVLNRGFAGVRLSLWFSLGCISRYRVWVVLQLFLDSRFQQRSEGVFVRTGKQFVTPGWQSSIGSLAWWCEMGRPSLGTNRLK